MEQYIKNFYNEFNDEFQKVSWEEIAKAIKILNMTYEAGGTVYLIGNGGSSSIASHWANDLNKSVLGHKGDIECRRFKAICLSDNVPVLTAWANDVGYDVVFSEQLKNFISPTDTLIAISSSGNSTNIVNAIEVARAHKIPVISLVGFSGGKAGEMSDSRIHVPSDKYFVVEPIHDAITHIITGYFHESLKQTSGLSR
jgi:D-sedoheptulose 7-phosphate isomerase